MRLLRRMGPWAASAALHAGIGVVAFIDVTGMESDPAPVIEDATYSVTIRPGGETRVSESVHRDGSEYGVPQDMVTVEDAPLTGAPEWEASSFQLPASSQTPRKGTGIPPTTFTHAPVARLPQGGGGSTDPKTVASSGGGLGTGKGEGAGEGREEGVEAIPLETPPPAYPDKARRGQLQGTVVAEIKINALGQVESAQAAKGSGSAVLDEAALAAVKGWRYRPATRNGRAIPSIRRVTFIFKLE